MSNSSASPATEEKIKMTVEVKVVLGGKSYSYNIEKDQIDSFCEGLKIFCSQPENYLKPIKDSVAWRSECKRCHKKPVDTEWKNWYGEKDRVAYCPSCWQWGKDNGGTYNLMREEYQEECASCSETIGMDSCIGENCFNCRDDFCHDCRVMYDGNWWCKLCHLRCIVKEEEEE